MGNLVEEIVKIVDRYGIPIDGTPTSGVFLEDAKAEMIIRLIVSAIRGGRLEKELGVVGPRIEGHIVHFPADDKPWSPSTHFRATGSHSSLALTDGLIGIDGEEAEAAIFAVSGTGTEEEA